MHFTSTRSTVTRTLTTGALCLTALGAGLLAGCDRRTPVQPETSGPTSTMPSPTTPPDVPASGAPGSMPGAPASSASNP